MRSRRLVIDASVAGAAGATEHPTSKANRDFLEEVRRICHRVVMPPEIFREWRAHSSNFSVGWLAAMERRRKVKRDVVSEVLSLRASMSRADFTPRQQSALEKDLPLIETALAADQIVISRDEEARALFTRLAAKCQELRKIVWLRPDESPDEALDWLRRGARPVRKWQLRGPTAPG
jgi:predicted nuclease of predicted toxin-antitoxin system